MRVCEDTTSAKVILLLIPTSSYMQLHLCVYCLWVHFVAFHPQGVDGSCVYTKTGGLVISRKVKEIVPRDFCAPIMFNPSDYRASVYSI